MPRIIQNLAGQRRALFAICGLMLGIAGEVQAVQIEMVLVGDRGNAPDMRYNLDQRPEGFGGGRRRGSTGEHRGLLRHHLRSDGHSL